MPAQRDDYLLREIDRLRELVARLLRGDRSDPTEAAAALQLAYHLQEKLFPEPPAEFLKREISAQIAALRTGVSPADTDRKCLLYARLLQETATLLAWRGREDLAEGARQLALHVALAVALEPAPAPEASDLVAAILPLLDPHLLHAPTRQLLDRFLASADPRGPG